MMELRPPISAKVPPVVADSPVANLQQAPQAPGKKTSQSFRLACEPISRVTEDAGNEACMSGGSLTEKRREATVRPDQRIKDVREPSASWQRRMDLNIDRLVAQSTEAAEELSRVGKQVAALAQALSESPRVATGNGSKSPRQPALSASETASRSTVRHDVEACVVNIVQTSEACITGRFDEMMQLYLPRLDQLIEDCDHGQKHRCLLEERMLNLHEMLQEMLTATVPDKSQWAAEASLSTSGTTKVKALSTPKPVTSDPLMEFGKIPTVVKESALATSEEKRAPGSRPSASSMVVGLSSYIRSKSQHEKEREWMEAYGEQDGHVVDSVQKCLDHLQVASFVLVGLNTIFLGAMLDMSMPFWRSDQTPPVWPGIVDHIFTGLFCLEMLMRMCLEKFNFLTGINAAWNIFDLLVVLLQLVDSLFFHRRGNTTFLRLFRILRVIRVSRMIRTLKSLRAFRLLLHVETWRPLFWCLFVMVAFMYLFALIITTAVGGWISDHEELPPRMLDLYGSVSRTMVTLFKSIAGGEAWHSLVAPLKAMSWIWEVAFLGYVFTMIFGFFNQVSALYVDGILHASALDRAVVMTERNMTDKAKFMDIKDLFQNHTYNSKLSYRTLVEVLRDTQGSKALRSVGLDVFVAKALFRLLDTEDKDLVDIDEYINSLRLISGNAASMHQATLVYQNKRMLVQIRKLEAQLVQLLSLHIGPSEAAKEVKAVHYLI